MGDVEGHHGDRNATRKYLISGLGIEPRVELGGGGHVPPDGHRPAHPDNLADRAFPVQSSRNHGEAPCCQNRSLDQTQRFGGFIGGVRDGKDGSDAAHAVVPMKWISRIGIWAKKSARRALGYGTVKSEEIDYALGIAIGPFEWDVSSRSDDG
jgi:hypothetical protein